MRKEPYGIGSIVHAVKRGARGFPFLKDATDKQRLLLLLAHGNDDAALSPNWFRELQDENKIGTFERASLWSERNPLVCIHCFCLHDNHYHFLLEEIVEGGIARFMQKTGTALSSYLNEKYDESGSPFQGSYKSKTIDSDAYLRYVIAYIEVKNAFEQFPGGYAEAALNFDMAFEWAIQFPHSSLHDHLCRSDLHKSSRGIVSVNLTQSLWTSGEFKTFARDVIEGRAHLSGLDKKAFTGTFV